jgi:hypothetical protein
MIAPAQAYGRDFPYRPEPVRRFPYRPEPVRVLAATRTDQ